MEWQLSFVRFSQVRGTRAARAGVEGTGEGSYAVAADGIIYHTVQYTFSR